MIFLYKNQNDEIPAIDELRPIAITSPIFKIIERAILSRIENHTSEKIIKEINPVQHGFTKQASTETQLMKLLITIKTLREETKNIYVTFYDFSAAFDNVDWLILFEKLKMHRFPLELIKTIQILFSGIHAGIDGNSTTAKILTGVP